MNNKAIAKIVSVVTSGFMLFSAGSVYLSHSERNQDGTYNVSEENRAELLGIGGNDEFFLGAASQFSVFVRDDFAAYGSDCEGRLAAGGNANVGDPVSYSVGARLDDGFKAAQVVVGGSTLTNFQPQGKKFVVGTKGNISPEILAHMNDGQTEVYIGKLIDFDKEFALLHDRSAYLAAQMPNAMIQVDEYYSSGWKITGSDKNLNVVDLTAEQMKTFDGGYIDLSVQIPEGSYLVINVPGTDINMPKTNVKIYDENGVLLRQGGENMPVLYNLKEATKFKYSGSIQGSTLAPDADASGDEGGHVAGATIAKSFSGGIQFGYSAFNPAYLDITDETTTSSTSTTTTTTTTTTTSTTTTTTTSTTTTSTTTTTTTTSTTATTSTSTTTTTSAASASSTSKTTSAQTTTTAKSTVSTGSKTVDSPKTGDKTIFGALALLAASASVMVISKKREK